jgi:uncharacterized protein
VLLIFLEKERNMYKDSPSKVWRMQKNKYHLMGGKCRKCQRISYPSGSICSECGSIDNTSPYLLKPFGKIVSYSLIYSPPSGFDGFVPYPIVLIKLQDGPIVMSLLTDYEEKDLKVGKKVRAVFRKIGSVNNSGLIQYGSKFKPV